MRKLIWVLIVGMMIAGQGCFSAQYIIDEYPSHYRHSPDDGALLYLMLAMPVDAVIANQVSPRDDDYSFATNVCWNVATTFVILMLDMAFADIFHALFSPGPSKKKTKPDKSKELEGMIDMFRERQAEVEGSDFRTHVLPLELGLQDQLAKEKGNLTALEERYIDLVKRCDALKAKQEGKSGDTIVSRPVIATLKNGNILILALCKKDGIEAGMQLGVYRHGRLIGKAVVDKVGEEYSIITLTEMKDYKSPVFNLKFKPLDKDEGNGE